MKQAPFFILACYNHFVITCTVRQTAANPGRSCNSTETRVGEINSGLPLIRPTARGTDFSTSLGTRVPAVAAVNLAGPPTGAAPGRLPSLFLSQLIWELSMWTRMEISSLAAKAILTMYFTAYAQVTPSSGTKHRPLTR